MQLIHVFLNINLYLQQIIQSYPQYTYGLLFVLFFAETGLIVTPFLPGDSLLFFIGSLAANNHHINLILLSGIILLGIICGDNCNFLVGKYLGNQLFNHSKSSEFRQKILIKTKNYYQRYGSKTVIIARFIPIIRTFAPCVAGVGQMKYSIFLRFSILGGILWLVVCLSAGYIFGNIPIVKHNFSVVLLVIILLSILPAFKIIIAEIRQGKHK